MHHIMCQLSATCVKTKIETDNIYELLSEKFGKIEKTKYAIVK